MLVQHRFLNCQGKIFMFSIFYYYNINLISHKNVRKVLSKKYQNNYEYHITQSTVYFSVSGFPYVLVNFLIPNLIYCTLCTNDKFFLEEREKNYYESLSIDTFCDLIYLMNCF